jgi:hypothetical protein
MKYLRQRTSGAAGNGLGTTIKHLRQTPSGAAGNGLGATMKYLRQTTSGAAGNGLGTTIKHLRRTTSGAAGYGRASRPITCAAPRHNKRRHGQRPGHHDQLPAAHAALRASAWAPRSSICNAKRAPPRELELELIRTQMAQKPMLRAEAYARALCAYQNVKRVEVWVGARCA